VTGGEDDNKGYIVEKRPSYGGDFQEVHESIYVSIIHTKIDINLHVYECIYILLRRGLHMEEISKR
jgi:hypothetical protein